MPTPIENLTQNVNASSQRTVMQAVADDATARQQAADKPSAINAIVDNADQQAKLNFFGGIPGDATAEDLLASVNAVIDKVSEDVAVIEELNASESAIRKLLCRREGRDPANFADLDAVAADQGLMQSIAGRQESSKILARSQKASAAAATAATAMSAIGNSATARSEVYASSTALSEIRPISQAIAKLSAGEAGQDASSYPDMAALAADASAMQAVAASQTAMQEVAVSQTAMQEVIASQTARNGVFTSQTARNEVFTSQTAMQEVAASQTAMQELAASQTAMQELAASQTAMTEIDQVDFAVRAIMCGTTSQDPTSFADADAISQDTAAMSEIAGDDTTMATIAASQTAMQEVAASQTAMQEVAASQTAVDAIGSNANENITANTVLNSTTATQEFQNSPLEQRFETNFGNSFNAATTLTNSRVLVTSNNNSGRHNTNISFSNDVGPRTQSGSTFIINGANSNNGDNFRGGSIGFNGIVIN